MSYDTEIMDSEDLTPQEFEILVLNCALDDFNGGVQFEKESIDMEEC